MNEATLEYSRWLAHVDDPELAAELRGLAGRDKSITERFDGSLTFGTAGLRGVMSAGTKRMNIYVIRKATQGLADYLKTFSDNTDRGVAIAYDTRRNSRRFAHEAARVLTANGIRVWLFDDIAPTPMLAFSIRNLGAKAGIVVTSSHNPPEYNGYKVYWENGVQIGPGVANALTAAIDAVPYDFSPVQTGDVTAGNGITFIGETVFTDYFQALAEHASFQKDTAVKLDTGIVYTALNGTGTKHVRTALHGYGFTNIVEVREQCVPDPDFSTVGRHPNPEEKSAYRLARKYADVNSCDVIIATDPDADRVGVMYREASGEFRLVSGNELGALLLHHIISKLQAAGRLAANSFMVTTVVTGDRTERLAQLAGVEVYRTLTGFKYICGKADELISAGEGEFIFGFEESGGYTATPFVLDKDGIMCALLIAEMAGKLAAAGRTIGDAIEDIHALVGYHADSLINIAEGAAAYENVVDMMEDWRREMPAQVAGLNVIGKLDYLHDNTEMEKENLYKIWFSEHAWLAMRPSGTEPKIKIYMAVWDEDRVLADNRLAQMEALFR